MFVSVVIPFFSRQTGILVKSVQSALAQSYSNIEVIVVDDCSPVSARTELDGISDQRLKIVRSNRNLGGGMARNLGLEHSAGGYVAFLDFDDEWYESKLAIQVETLNRSKITDNIVVYSPCLIIDGRRQFVRPSRALRDDEHISDYLFTANELVQTSGLILSADLCLKVKFDDLPRHQDYQFVLSLFAYGCRFVMTPDPLYRFIQVPKINKVKFSEDWLENYAHLMTSSSIRGFKTLVIMRSIMKSEGLYPAAIYAINEKLPKGFYYLAKMLLRKVLKIL